MDRLLWRIHWKIPSNGRIRRHVACYHSGMQVIVKAIVLGFPPVIFFSFREITQGNYSSLGTDFPSTNDGDREH